MKTAQQIQDSFENYLQGLDYSREPLGLYAPIRYVLSLGGKRIRPTLLIMAYNMYAQDIESVFDAAAGMEIFHNFTLLHDDLMDKADLRRGQPTVHKKWDENAAILSGDGMLVLAYRYLAKASANNLKKILDIANDTFTGIMEGQQYDMEFETRDDVTEAEYIEMIRLKTSVLLAACVQIGAVIGGACDAVVHRLQPFVIALHETVVAVLGVTVLIAEVLAIGVAAIHFAVGNTVVLGDDFLALSTRTPGQQPSEVSRIDVLGLGTVGPAGGVHLMGEHVIDTRCGAAGACTLVHDRREGVALGVVPMVGACLTLCRLALNACLHACLLHLVDAWCGVVVGIFLFIPFDVLCLNGCHAHCE